MTPRVQIKGVELSTPAHQLLARVAEAGHQRVPVYTGSADQVVGIVALKDVAGRVARGEAPTVPAVLRQALFVPESARISALLREFQRSGQSLAIVVDEYGSVEGLVTVEDVVEEIVGDIGEAADATAASITALPDGSALIDGMATLEEVERVLGIALPESRDYVTVAGYILAILTSVPTPGTTITAADRRWTVTDMDGPRIRRVKLEAA
jgi:CBS domain containing-hemolysin-like protein